MQLPKRDEKDKNKKILFLHIQTLTFLLLGASEMYLVSLMVLMMTTLQVSALGSEDFDDDVVRLSILAWASFTALSLSARNFASDFKSSGFWNGITITWMNWDKYFHYIFAWSNRDNHCIFKLSAGSKWLFAGSEGYFYLVRLRLEIITQWLKLNC